MGPGPLQQRRDILWRIDLAHARLARRRQHPQAAHLRMGHGRLLQAGVAPDHIAIGKQQAVAHTKHQIQTAQPGICIDEQDLFAQGAQGDGNIGAEGGLPRPALAGGHRNDTAHSARPFAEYFTNNIV